MLTSTTGSDIVTTPSSSDELRLALRAATMYHVEGATQAEIAAKLGVSRPTAGRLVARARANGLVRIEIHVPEEISGSVHTDLERRLSPFAAHTSGSAGDSVPAVGACGRCGDPRGPGACSMN